jgi:protein-export membrane protein SecD/preprotein translocase SecF subunit
LQNRSYLFLLLVVVLGGLSTWLFIAKPPSYGLDVVGGIRLTYQLDFSKLPLSTNKAEAMAKEVLILDARAKGMAGEGTAQSKGNDQVIVEIPNATNVQEARDVMGTSAKIYMYHAKTLATERYPNKRYQNKSSDDPNNPQEYFVEAGTGKVIKPGDPEYLKIIGGWDEILSGDDLESAGSRPAGTGYFPTMKFSPKGAAKMSAWSSKYYNTGEKLAYVLDNKVLNIAPLADGAHISDAAEISGSFSPQYVSNLTTLLNAGALPVDLKELSFETVDPTIGSHALDQITTAGAIAFGVVVLFLIGYYAFPGIVATIALALYVLFTLSVMKAINATFSLAAIAGFILSVGMAVDANILVFERFKEEIKKGRTLHSAILLGFKRALPAIVDSNACTILTSMVLATLGTGPVKGFATTLIIGVLVSLFTAIVVTRSLLLFFVDSGVATNVKWYAVERNWFKKLEARADTEPLQVVEKWKRWFVISALTILVCVPFFFMGGFRLNVEFQGGYEAKYGAAGKLESNTTYAANLEKAGLKGSNVKFASYDSPGILSLTFKDLSKIEGDNKLETILRVLDAIDAKPLSGPTITPTTLSVQFALDDLHATTKDPVLAKLSAAFGNNFDWDVKPDPNPRRSLIYVSVPPNPQIAALKTADGKQADTAAQSTFVAEKAGLKDVAFRGFTEVGPVIQKETIKNALLAILFSSALIIVYLSFRFGFSLGGFIPGLRFGFSAILALLHDILVVAGSSAVVGYLLGWEISALFITAMLTVIGFSVHDTIVVFDRIRENLSKPDKGHDLGFVMDRSITQTFSRSINTSGTVIVTLAILIAFGTATPDLKFFCVAMLIGIASGTYSSIYNASPILYLWDKAVVKKNPKAGLIALALEEQAKHRIMQTQVRSEAAPQVQSTDTGRTYGQVRRRASAEKPKGHIEIEDEP